MSGSEEVNVNRDWNFEVNLVGLTPATGIEVPEGFYKAKVTDMYINPEKKDSRVVIKLAITEGQYRGAVRTSGINLPKDENDSVRYYWRGLAESVGHKATDLDNGAVNLSLGSFKERVAHIRYTPKSMTTDGFDKVNFIPPAEWTQQKQLFDGEAAGKGGTKLEAGGGGNGLGTASPPSAGTSKDAVKRALGL